MAKAPPDGAQSPVVRHKLVDGVLTITLDDAATRNAIGPDVNPAITALMSRAAHETSVRAVVLTGANGYFSSGGNVAALERTLAMSEAERSGVTDRRAGMIESVRGGPKPVVAAVEGGAAGIGFSLVLAADIVVAARDARFAAAQVRLGLTPDGGITRFLAEAMPHQLVAEILLRGRPVSAARLHDFGLVNELVEPGDALATATAMALSLAEGPTRAIARIKRLLADARTGTLADTLAREGAAINAARSDPEAAEGIAAFREKRPPRFGGGEAL